MPQHMVAQKSAPAKLVHSRQALPIGVAAMKLNYVSFKIQFLFGIQEIKNRSSLQNNSGNCR